MAFRVQLRLREVSVADALSLISGDGLNFLSHRWLMSPVYFVCLQSSVPETAIGWCVVGLGTKRRRPLCGGHGSCLFGIPVFCENEKKQWALIDTSETLREPRFTANRHRMHADSERTRAGEVFGGGHGGVCLYSWCGLSDGLSFRHAC